MHRDKIYQPVSQSGIADGLENETNYNSCSNTSYLLTVLEHLLLRSGDIESNPGPRVNPLDLCVVHINTQSIRNKIDLIQAECSNFDIITVSESWLCDSDSDHTVSLVGFHSPIRRDRPNDPHGGVAIYVRNTLYCKHRPDLHIPHLEAVWVETKLNQESFLVGSFYRPPNSSAHYWTLIAESVNQANNTGMKYIILGDFNSDWHNAPSHHLTNIINRFQMKQFINEPTRVTDATSTCLDLVLSPCHHFVTQANVLPEICSDHRVPCVKIKNAKPKHKSNKRTIYNYSKLDQTKFDALLSRTDWDNILLHESINCSAYNFTRTLFDLAKTCMPTKQIHVRPNDAPWINDEIRLLIFEKSKIHKVAKQSNSPEDWAKFRQTRNNLTSKIRERKREYLEDLDARACDPSKFGTKEWWRLVNTFLSKKGMESDEIPPIEHNNSVFYSNKDKAEAFNNYFISQAEHGNDNNVDLPDFTTDNLPVLRTIILSTNDVANAIRSLKSNKAVGPDLIHNRILKAASNYITEPLTRYFNRCLSESKFPDPWKVAHVTPLYKKGQRELCSNYRPISLLSCVGKMFESCVQKHIFAFLKENTILTSSQSGFIPGDSTINQLLIMYDSLCSAFDDGITTQAVYLDITKAFDRVWHRGLLHKLESVGIIGSMLDWFKNYLNNRKQAVVIRGEISEFKTIVSGVPQGSVLGPLLFLIYINDIVEDIQSDIRLFADDTSLSLAHDNPITQSEILNYDLDRIVEWSHQWKVNFNQTKTEVVNFVQGSHQCEQLTFDNIDLEPIDNHKHLGIVFQSNFKWDTHIQSIASKVTMLISCLSSYKYRLGRKTLETLYKSFIMPHFDYADVIWDSCTDTLSNILEDLHLQALRIITGSVRGTSHHKLYEESGFGTLKDRRQRHKLILFKKITLGLCPNSLTDLLPPLVSATNPYPRRRPQERTVPACRTETYRKSYFPSTTSLWNDLPLVVQQSTSLGEFKRYFSSSDPVVPTYYYLGDRKEQIIHCRLRLGMSDLNSDLHSRHLQENRACSCGFIQEDAYHYLLICENYTDIRRNTIFSLSHHHTDIQTLLFGSPGLQLQENASVFVTVHEFIKLSNRFN
jgi:hypothetical protein